MEAQSESEGTKKGIEAVIEEFFKPITGLLGLASLGPLGGIGSSFSAICCICCCCILLVGLIIFIPTDTDTSTDTDRNPLTSVGGNFSETIANIIDSLGRHRIM